MSNGQNADSCIHEATFQVMNCWSSHWSGNFMRLDYNHFVFILTHSVHEIDQTGEEYFMQEVSAHAWMVDSQNLLCIGQTESYDGWCDMRYVDKTLLPTSSPVWSLKCLPWMSHFGIPLSEPVKAKENDQFKSLFKIVRTLLFLSLLRH